MSETCWPSGRSASVGDDPVGDPPVIRGLPKQRSDARGPAAA